ncbi:MAG: hypothetical protein AB1758_29345, partial [Candidatus Eremiobacterota bacterium]
MCGKSDDSPLRYKINRLGGRSRQEKWILQSELFNEVHKLVQAHPRFFKNRFGFKADRAYPLFRDFLAGVRRAAGEVWGQNQKYMFTKDVTLKALVRVLGSLLTQKKVIDHW